MAYALNLRSDDVSSGVVKKLWRKFEYLETKPSMRSLAYRPHITFAIYDRADIAALNHALESCFRGAGKLTLQFKQYGMFEFPDGYVLWLKPEQYEPLRVFHNRIHSMLDTGNCRVHYRPGNWVPHCSIATAIDADRAQELMSVVENSFEPFSVVFDVADCVSFVPVSILNEVYLTVPA